MSSKMLAGLVAGGFGAALSIGLTLSTHFSSQLAFFLAVVLLFGLGALSGIFAAAWLDLPDYGHQQAAGAIAGLVAAGLTEVSDLALRLLFASISSASPTSVLENLVISRLPAPDPAARILFVIIVNVLLYLLYVLIVVGMSGAVATFAGRAKSVEALQALLEVRQPVPDEPSEAALVDPALLPFMRPEYSPFIPEEPPIPVPLWQQRRTAPKEAPPTGQAPLPGKSNPFPARQGLLSRENGRRSEGNRQPSDQRGQSAPRSSVSGGLYPSGAPARGTAPGVGQRRSTSGVRPPPNAPWPRPRDKD